MKSNYWLYLFILPGFLYLIIFKYLPMCGVVIAFQDFNVVKGILHSPFVGLKHFKYLFGSQDFYKVFKNSFILSVARLLAGFPAPIILALLLNEMRSQKYKKTMQTILYLPHFISWVVIYGLLINFLSPSTGIINNIAESLGGKSIPFLTSPKYFRPMVVLSDIWKSVGWGTVVYMAAIAGISPEYYEAATIDGASRFQRMFRITLPLISSTIVVMLILRAGSIISNGFEQVYLMQNSLNIDVSEVFETYTYKIGINEGRFSFSTAVGLFQSVIGFILIMVTNKFAKKTNNGGLW